MQKNGGGVLTEERDPEFSSRLDAAMAEEPDAIRELVEEFKPGLTSYARRQGMTDPEGMANAALFGALQNLDNLRGRDRGTFRGYLYRILRRRVVDEIRYRSVRPHTVGDLNAELSARVADDQASAFDERVVDEDFVDALLTKLTSEQRQILELRLINDLSIQETADRTGRSVPAVKAMQRRAIVSLRVAAAAMAIIAVVVGLRVASSGSDQTVVVENGPAGQSVGEGGDGTPTAPADTEDDTEIPARGEGEEGARAGDEGLVIEGASSVAATEPDSATTTTPPTAEAGDAASDPAGAGTEDAGVEPPAEPEPVPVAPAAACTVVTDGSPQVGEIGVVTYTFSGPYALFRGTSAQMIGRSQASATLTGFGSTDSVGNNKRFPFTITPNMFADGRFVPKTTLVGGEIKTACEVAEQSAPTPCQVTTDGSPSAGEEATVSYDLRGAYGLLDERWSYVVGRDGKSAMRPGGSHQIISPATFTFEIDNSMLTDGHLDVTSAFRGGEGIVRCEVLTR